MVIIVTQHIMVFSFKKSKYFETLKFYRDQYSINQKNIKNLMNYTASLTSKKDRSLFKYGLEASDADKKNIELLNIFLLHSTLKRKKV